LPNKTQPSRRISFNKLPGVKNTCLEEILAEKNAGFAEMKAQHFEWINVSGIARSKLQIALRVGCSKHINIKLSRLMLFESKTCFSKLKEIKKRNIIHLA